jgi:hypothetical protein
MAFTASSCRGQCVSIDDASGGAATASECPTTSRTAGGGAGPRLDDAMTTAGRAAVFERFSAGYRAVSSTTAPEAAAAARSASHLLLYAVLTLCAAVRRSMG